MASLTDQEKLDIEAIAQDLPNANLSEGLQYMLDREIYLLEQTDMGEGKARDVTLRNISLLTAASSRIGDLAEAENNIIKENLNPESGD